MTQGAERHRRGRLTVYLGAAPGVGKTYAMLGEAHRRRDRGTDVVVGYVETHGRPRTAAQLEGLEVVPRAEVAHRGTVLTEMDLPAVLERAPAVVLVDELAHTNATGGPHARRADDVARLLAAGIDVLTTVNIQHLESLNDEVERITGVRQRETVPDEVVRAADQVQLVDMAPDALRRRLAHGNVYRAENVDASLTSFFRVGNLTALRELALLWVADRVDDALDDYRREHRIRASWPTKERIVVAVTGGPESETLVRRGARLAQRSAGSELLAVHVLTADGLHHREDSRVVRTQQLVASLGGTFRTVVGEDVSEAVVDVAVGANATMIVVGVSRHGRLRRLARGSTGDRIARLAGQVDVHLVTHEQVARTLRGRRALSPLPPARRALGWVAAVVLPLGLATVLHGYEDTDQLPLASLLLLAATVGVAVLGGLLPALLAAAVGFVTLNYWFTPPVGGLAISQPADVVALVVFVGVAAAVATVVDQASRRTTEALRARTEAATMGSLSRSVLTGQDTAEAIVERLREVFGQEAVALLARGDAGWTVVAAAGATCPTSPEEGDTRVAVDEDHVLVLRGVALRATDQRVLEGFAVQTSLVLEYRRLRDREDRAVALERADATSTALLRAVSHDLRTPLAVVRTAVDGLGDPRLDEADRRELVGEVDAATGRLERLIDDLLDLSRLETGLLRPVVEPTSLEEILPPAVAGAPPGSVELDIDEATPLVLTDAALVERVVANLVGNAVRVSGGTPVRVLAHPLATTVDVLVVDRGPGVAPELRERMFEPFQRLSDSAPGGLGLGLAVARGLCEAVDATLAVEDTPGGGLTLVLSLPRAGERRTPGEGT
ncbi:DUF4118 domain-containing protein [Nocardioides aurantiacus]|uniref:DUF4118 domain-containing protein n=1 Tax=Nocardioides aurantiacus TaxID=86796 RepID=UPI00403FB4DC